MFEDMASSGPGRFPAREQAGRIGGRIVGEKAGRIPTLSDLFDKSCKCQYVD
jgi:hypothetical protein